MNFWFSLNNPKYHIMALTVISFFTCTNNTPEKKSVMDMSLYQMDTKITVKLPKKLQELSGLTLSPDGRLFGHDDEKGEIYEIDQSSGSIMKSFSLGRKSLKKDFEGIAYTKDLIYMVTSDGQIYEFKEGENKSSVSYKKYDTKLTSKYNIEGLCYDHTTESLLLACKAYPGKGYNGKRAVYSFSLTDKKLDKEPRFLISIDEINELTEKGITEKLGDFFLLTDSKFAPSGIERHPEKGSFYILSSREPLIIEISKEGKLMGIILLDKKHHNQPEGITFGKDLSLVIGDEGGDGKSKITIYSVKQNN
jgi:uncharacterized protein YjiK